MSKEYIKKTVQGVEQLEELNVPKRHVFNSIAEATYAAAHPDDYGIKDGDQVSTKFLDTASDNAQALGIIADRLNTVESYIPSDTSTTNMLVNQSELNRVERLIPADASNVNPLTVQSWVEDYIGDQLEPRDEAIATKAAQTDLTALANRVSTNETILFNCTTSDKAVPYSALETVDNKFANYELKSDATSFKNTINSYLPASVSASNKLVTVQEIPAQVTFSLSGTTLTIIDGQ
jgi:hypothetical protein